LEIGVGRKELLEQESMSRLGRWMMRKKMRKWNRAGVRVRKEIRSLTKRKRRRRRKNLNRHRPRRLKRKRRKERGR
jgi:hypothetical protein